MLQVASLTFSPNSSANTGSPNDSTIVERKETPTEAARLRCAAATVLPPPVSLTLLYE